MIVLRDFGSLYVRMPAHCFLAGNKILLKKKMFWFLALPEKKKKKKDKKNFLRTVEPKILKYRPVVFSEEDILVFYRRESTEENDQMNKSWIPFR